MKLRNNGAKMSRDPGDVDGWTNLDWNRNIFPGSTNACLKRRGYYSRHRRFSRAARYDKEAHNPEPTCQRSNNGSNNYVFFSVKTMWDRKNARMIEEDTILEEGVYEPGVVLPQIKRMTRSAQGNLYFHELNLSYRNSITNN